MNPPFSPPLEIIHSSNNQRLKEWRKLSQRKQRHRNKHFLVEGYHLIEEALLANAEVKELIFSTPKVGALEAMVKRYRELPLSIRNVVDKGSVEITFLEERLFNELFNLPAPQGIGALIGFNHEVRMGGDGALLLLDRIQDPGNLGTIIRTATAAGFGGIYLGEGSVDPYNEKVIRATQGALFHLPLVEIDLAHLLPQLKRQGYTIWATDLRGAKSYHQLPVPKQVALILGNEGSGVAPSLVKEADQAVKIPHFGAVESLNVASAAAILLYHIALSHRG